MTAETEYDYDFSEGMGSQTAEEEHAKRRGPSFQLVDFLSLDGSERGRSSGANLAVVRFVTDLDAPARDEKGNRLIRDAYEVPWITVEMHSMVPTKPKPADLKDGVRWQKEMPFVCRKDKIFTRRFGGECWVCEKYGSKNKPRPRTWALAIQREEVRDEAGKLVGMRDQVKELGVSDPADPTKLLDQTVVVPRFVKINYGWQNFFEAVQGFGKRYGTLLDRDYFIERRGMGPNDTNYHPQPYDKDPEHDLSNLDYLRATYPEFVEVEGQQVRTYPDLRRIVADQCSDEYMERWFVETGPRSGGTSPAGPEAPSGPQPVQAGQGATSDALSALKDRVMSSQPSAPAGPGGPAN